MPENDIGEIKAEILKNRELIRELISNIEILKTGAKSKKTAVLAVPQRSQPPQGLILPPEKEQEFNDHKKRASTYYPRCFNKRSKNKTLIRNCKWVLESIAFVLPYTTEKADIDKLKKRQNEVSKQFNTITKTNSNILLRRV